MPSHPCQEVFNACTTLRCPYGIEAYIDNNDCHRCQCRDPCRGVECLEDERCAIDINRNKSSNTDADFIAICRKSKYNLLNLTRCNNLPLPHRCPISSAGWHYCFE